MNKLVVLAAIFSIATLCVTGLGFLFFDEGSWVSTGNQIMGMWGLVFLNWVTGR